MKFLAVAVLCGLVALSAGFTMTELAEITEQYRVMFDELHEEKDFFVDVVRLFASEELRWLNEASVNNLAEAWSDIEHNFDYTREVIAKAILDDNTDEDCLLGLVEEIVAEQIRAAGAMSACAADKIAVKETLADEMIALAALLQRISTAAAEYTLYTFAIHNSFIDSEGHVEWLERNYQNQVEFWQNYALPEAQEDLDNIELRRPELIAENRACLDAIRVQMAEVDRNINQRVPQCVGSRR